MRPKRIVVVGAGVGGLGVAWRLAEAGHRVVVFEQADTVGGKLGVFARDGFRFDTGPHLVTLPHLYVELDLPFRRVAPIARYRFGDGAVYDHVDDPGERATRLEALRPGNSADMEQFLARAANIWECSRGPFLEMPLRARSFARISVARDIRTVAPFTTLHALARRTFADPRLVDWADRFATYSGSDPRRAPAALASIAHVESAFGAWYIDGGLGRIGEALVTRCRSLGVEIRTGQDVAEIETRGHRASGVRLVNGERVSADIVVANADAAHIAGDLLRAPDARWLHRRLRRGHASFSGFVLLLALDGTTAEQVHHTVLFPHGYLEEFDDLFGHAPKAVRAPTIYLSVPDDPQIAPAGCESWFVLVNAPRHDPAGLNGIDWDTPGFADGYADKVLDIMAERGVDVRRRVRFRHIRTPADLARRTRAVGGSIYGTAQNDPFSAFLRPPNRTPVGGLYLVGGSAHPGGGLPLVTLSARIVADLIEGDG